MGLVFRVQGLGFRIQAFGHRVCGIELSRVHDLGNDRRAAKLGHDGRHAPHVVVAHVPVARRDLHL